MKIGAEGFIRIYVSILSRISGFFHLTETRFFLYFPSRNSEIQGAFHSLSGLESHNNSNSGFFEFR